MRTKKKSLTFHRNDNQKNWACDKDEKLLMALFKELGKECARLGLIGHHGECIENFIRSNQLLFVCNQTISHNDIVRSEAEKKHVQCKKILQWKPAINESCGKERQSCLGSQRN